MWRFLVTRPDGKGSESLIVSDLPVSEAEVMVQLSGPASIQLTLPLYFQHLVGDDGNPVFIPWGSMVYAERNGVIMGGAIVEEIDATGAQLHISAIGFTEIGRAHV